MILLLIFLANTCSVLVMILAGRYDGAAASFVAAIRSFLFLFKERAKDNKIFWFCFLAHAVAGVVTWQSPISMLTIVATLVLTATNWFGSVNVIKWGTIISDACWTVFDMMSGVYVEGLKDLMALISNAIGLWRGRTAAE